MKINWAKEKVKTVVIIYEVMIRIRKILTWTMIGKLNQTRRKKARNLDMNRKSKIWERNKLKLR